MMMTRSSFYVSRMVTRFYTSPAQSQDNLIKKYPNQGKFLTSTLANSGYELTASAQCWLSSLSHLPSAIWHCVFHGLGTVFSYPAPKPPYAQIRGSQHLTCVSD